MNDGDPRRQDHLRIKTDSSVKAARPDSTRQLEYPVDGVRGLALRISPAGAKTWTLRYRTRDGEQRRLTLGRYPTLGLSKARDLAAQAIGGVAGGSDPAKARRASKALAKARKLSTVAGLIETYFDDAEEGRHRPNARPKRSRTMTDERGWYARLIKPRFGRLPVADLTRHDVQRFIDEIGKEAPAVARRCRNIIRQAFNYGVRREVVSHNPAQLSHVPITASRERVLTDGELRAIWEAAINPSTVKGLDLGPGTGLALCLAMLTLQRGGEICGIHARELDRATRTWTIPGDRVKNHKTHVVPLSEAAVEILDRAFSLAAMTGRRPTEAWEGYAFPSPKPRAHADRTTLAEQPITRHAFSRAMARLRSKLKIEDATPHDFRRTGATNLTGERIGIPRFIVSRVLNQISDTGGAAAVTGVYDRNEYLAEKRRALDAWAALLAQIVSDDARSSNVVALPIGQSGVRR